MAGDRQRYGEGVGMEAYMWASTSMHFENNFENSMFTCGRETAGMQY
jgi:hypothetical protein